MSQFLKQNLYQTKSLTENRVLMLTEKINSLKIGQRADVEKKIDSLHRQVSGLEEELVTLTSSCNDRHCELKHIFGKISKELISDFAETDRVIREQTERVEELAMKMITHHINERKASDSRISRFVDQKSAILRDLIEREAKERISSIKEIEESLSRDLGFIREKMELEADSRENRIQAIHGEFLRQYEKIHLEFVELSQKYSDSEGDFFKMLRDILKKVKGEMGEAKRDREEMEESILILIEKLCDKAIEEAGVE